jgi:SHS2 domain-containing protein
MPHVNAHHKRVSLAGKDLDLIHVQWLNVVSIYLDYSQCVVVDGELPVWIAGNGNKAEAVTAAEVINSHNCRQGR